MSISAGASDVQPSNTEAEVRSRGANAIVNLRKRERLYRRMPVLTCAR